MSGESRKINKQCEMEKNGEQKKKGVFLTLTPRVTPKLHKLPNATVDDVQNHYSNFIRQCGSKATLYRSSNEFYSKANFILSEGSSYHNKDTIRMILLDRGLLFTQEFDKMGDPGERSLENRVANTEYYKNEDGLSPLQYTEERVRELHPDMSPAMRKNFEQYAETLRTKKCTCEQRKNILIPEDGLTEHEYELLKKYIQEDFLPTILNAENRREKRKRYSRPVSAHHRVLLDETREQENKFDKLYAEARKWLDTEIDIPVKKKSLSHLELLKFIKKVLGKKLHIRTFRIDEMIDEMLVCEPQNAYLLYKSACKFLRKPGTKEFTLYRRVYKLPKTESRVSFVKTIEKIWLAIAMVQFCYKDDNVAQQAALRKIWCEWVKDGTLQNKYIWDQLSGLDSVTRGKIEDEFPPIKLGLYIKQLVHMSLPDTVRYLAYNLPTLERAKTVERFKRLYPAQYHELMSYEWKIKHPDEYKKLWFDVRYDREERRVFLKSCLDCVNIDIINSPVDPQLLNEYKKLWSNTQDDQDKRKAFLKSCLACVSKNIDISADSRLWIGHEKFEKRKNRKKNSDTMNREVKMLRLLIREKVLQDCILEETRTRLWDMATKYFLFN